MADSRLTRIGVFYDGNYFFHVSNYYAYAHPRKARLSLSGLHEFIRCHVAELEDSDPKLYRIVEPHYFRGRLSATEANARQKLFAERVFDDVLMREGVVTHYLPVTKYGEKGIDVWLALEAFELVALKKFDVLVLITCDGDYVPLIRKIKMLGTRVMVLGWDFDYTDSQETVRKTLTSRDLLEEADYPVLMHKIINDKAQRNDALINGLFLSQKKNNWAMDDTAPARAPGLAEANDKVQQGKIHSLLDGYGFIVPDVPSKNLFFFWDQLVNVDFNELERGDRVEYIVAQNSKGQDCAKEVRKI